LLVPAVLVLYVTLQPIMVFTTRNTLLAGSALAALAAAQDTAQPCSTYTTTVGASTVVVTVTLPASGSAAPASASSGTPTSAGPITFTNPSGSGYNWSTKTYNATGYFSTNLPNTDYSDEALNFLWDQVGPISTGPVTTTVSPTPEPSVYPTPGVFHPLVPSYEPALAGVKLPEGFTWGVASSGVTVFVKILTSHANVI
jgi:hypothetical protein